MPALGELALSRAAVDRAAHLRTDPAALEALWGAPGTRTVEVHAGGRFRTEQDGTALVLGAPAGQPAQQRVLLGVDAEQVAYFAVLSEEAEAPEDTVSLREVGTLLAPRDVGLAVNAVALANWHATHRHCPRCGAATEVVDGGHVRRCPVDGSTHYPRTDAAVIMAVVDEDDRLLLGRQASWPEGRFSTLAGFVEPGESLEQAVRREVAEEVGVLVGEVTYLGSQAWPFPASLMLGFTARALSTDLRADEVEIAEARWVSREEMAADIAAGSLRLPPEVSIARRLIEHWYGGPLVDETPWP